MTDWNSGFETNPAGTQALSLGDDVITELKVEIRERAQVELDWSNLGGLGDTGRLREGSARAFLQATTGPTLLGRTDQTGDNTLGTDDFGRLWVDTDDRLLYVYDPGDLTGQGGGWTRIVPSTGQVFERAEIKTGTGTIVSTTFNEPNDGNTWAIQAWGKMRFTADDSNMPKRCRAEMRFDNAGGGLNAVDVGADGDSTESGSSPAVSNTEYEAVTQWFFAPLATSAAYIFDHRSIQSSNSTPASGVLVVRMFPYLAP